MKQQNAPMRLLCCVSVVGLSLAGCSQKSTNVKPTPPPQATTQTSPLATASPDASRLYHYSKKGLREVNVKDTRTNKRVQYEYANLWDRLFDSYSLPDVRNSAVEREVSWYRNHPTYLQRAQQRAEPFLYNIVQQIERQDVPGEIALLPVVESAFQAHAVSPAKAAGIWQFIPATGRHYGLRQNHAYDGRRDVYASTRAAIKYLKKLNRQFDGDWLLAIAAYNCGEGAVERAIRRNTYAGLPTDFWSLDLPQETRSYVPRLLAVSRLMADADHYGVDLIHIPNQAQYKPVKVNQALDLAMAADAADMSLEQFKALNPGFKNSFVDPEGSVRLFVPAHKSKTFKKELARLASVQSDLLNREFERAQTTTQTIASASSEPVLVPAAYRPPTPRRPSPGEFSSDTGASDSLAMVPEASPPPRTSSSYIDDTADPFQRSLAADQSEPEDAAPDQSHRKGHRKTHFEPLVSRHETTRHTSRVHQEQKKNVRAGSAKDLDGSERAGASGRHGKASLASRYSETPASQRVQGDRRGAARSGHDGKADRSGSRLNVATAASSASSSRNGTQAAKIKTREASAIAAAPSSRAGARTAKAAEPRKAERIITAKADIAKPRARR